jgi:hypothetical protein
MQWTVLPGSDTLTGNVLHLRIIGEATSDLTLTRSVPNATVFRHDYTFVDHCYTDVPDSAAVPGREGTHYGEPVVRLQSAGRQWCRWFYSFEPHIQSSDHTLVDPTERGLIADGHVLCSHSEGCPEHRILAAEDGRLDQRRWRCTRHRRCARAGLTRRPSAGATW